MTNTFIEIHWTCAALEEARQIVRKLLEKRLIACANIIPHVESHYLWEGKLEQADEVKAILKTRGAHFPAVREMIEKECSYDVPEVTQVMIDAANPSYLHWLEQSTSRLQHFPDRAQLPSQQPDL
jgi:periplasmic divalent cation tolerance protein